MDLSLFIEETLIGIKKGLEGANRQSQNNYFVMMQHDKIDFDVALVVSEKIGGEGGAKIGVAAIATAGGSISTESQNEKTSRIKFSVKSGFNGFGSVSHG